MCTNYLNEYKHKVKSLITIRPEKSHKYSLLQRTKTKKQTKRNRP